MWAVCWCKCGTNVHYINWGCDNSKSIPVTVQKESIVTDQNWAQIIRSSGTFICTLLQCHSIYHSQDTMAESPTAASTPTSESTYHWREERAQRYLSRTSRAAYRLNHLLEWSLSSSISDLSQGPEPGSEGDEEETFRMRRQAKRWLKWKRGCPAVLKRIAKTYEKFWKAHWQDKPSTGGAVVLIRRILKYHREASLVSVLPRHRSVLPWSTST